MMTKEKDTTFTSLEESLFQETAPLGVVYATFDGYERGSFEALISGYSSMKVLTYSNSVSIVNRAAGALERLEVIFGREDIVGEMARYMHYQEVLIEELIEEIKGKDFIQQKIAAGDIKLYVVKDIISHEKLFLLEGEKGTRVITGSANFSEKAFSGSQNESYVCFDNDPAAWEHFHGKYEKIRDKSTLNISKKAVLASSFDAAHLPVLSIGTEDGASTIIEVPDRPPEPSVVQKMISPRTPRRYTGQAEVIKPKRGVARIDRPTAAKMLRYAKSNSRSEEENPEEYLSIHPESEQVILSGNELYLDARREVVGSAVGLLVEYFRGYERFRGDSGKLARDYFTFMSWFYAGPFICDLRNAALAEDDYVFDYPIFGILYGKSNCGKSELVRTLLISMFEREGFLRNEWFTKTGVAGLREQNRRYPLAFDDLDRTRFANHAVALIKDDHVGAREYPATVLSMNADKDTFEPEVRKRALIVYTGASLPDDTGESRDLARNIKRIKRSLDNALYREYLKRVLARLKQESPADILEFSSGVLYEIFSEHCAEPLPEWCRVVTMSEYGRNKHDKIKDELLQILKHNRSAWSGTGDKLALKLNDVYALRKLRKDVPDYLVASGSGGDAIVFDASELEGFLGVPLSSRGKLRRTMDQILRRQRK